MRRFDTRRCNELAVILAVLLSIGIAAVLTAQYPWTWNDYNSYTRQACAWLSGRLDLPADIDWLELAIYEGRYYVSFPPFPSYVMLPFAAVFGIATPDGWIALAVTLLGVWYAIRLYRSLGGPEKQLVFWVLFLYLGTGYLFIAMNGWVWFMAQTMCFTLSLMALDYAVEGRGGVSLTCWACAVGCRPMAALYFPLLAYILLLRLRDAEPEVPVWRLICRRLYWAIGPCLLAASYMVLNYLRFGNPLEFGHNYLPEFTREEAGQFSLTYLAENLGNLLRLPQLQSDGTLFFYNVNGVAFWLVNPLFLAVGGAWVYSLTRREGNRTLVLLIPLVSLLYLLVICCHRTLGGWQFGDRYLLDLMPYLFFGLVLWMPRGERFRTLCTPLMLFGFALNMIGTVMTYNNWI